MTASGTSSRFLLVGDEEWLAATRPAFDDPIAVTSVADALDRLRDSTVSGVVSALSLPDGTGIDLLRAVRDDGPSLPVVLYTDAGDEATASEAVAAGVTDYVPASEASADDLRERVARAVESGSEDADRDPRFEALFEDSLTATWLLSPDGRVRRANEAARSFGVPDGGALRESPWWADRNRVRETVERAADGEATTASIACDGSGRTDLTVELAVRPIAGEDALLATAIDATERAELARELRRSEELHRVTLNNMTDTVLVTDDEGAFTYICPNVHFIFGYSVAEIRELGTIDELLGPELFDPDDLREEGVLTNIECTATDKAGREHTLLVNVKRVSIQGGTTLYSCRDVTTRKQRDRALSTLHGTARELLYAERREEIAGIVAEDAADVLDLPGVACYLFDPDENRLRPAATTDALDALHGPPESHQPGDEGIVSRAFIGGEPVIVEDARAEDPATDLGRAIAVPLGDHGVLFAGAAETGGFGSVTEEVADLLAATAEAALDRVDREADLRERDRDLRRRNRQLSRLNRINDVIREIDGALVGAETREGIERAVCERLTADDRFGFAWIADLEPDGESIAPRAWAGDGREYLDAVPLRADGSEPTARTAASGSATVVENVADDPRGAEWRAAALESGYQSVVSVPLVHEGFTYGTLSVYADRPEAFDEGIRTVVSELAETIAAALTTVKQRNALLSDTVTELEYETAEESCTLLRLARAADCELELEGGVQQVEEGVLAFAAVRGAPVDRVLDAARSSVAVEEVRTVADREDGGLLQVRLAEPFVATRLADHGAVLRTLRADAATGTARLTVEVSKPTDVRTVDAVLTDRYSDATLIAQRDRKRAAGTGDRVRTDFIERLTDRQLEAVRTAYHSGFFESPRRCSGEEVADTLGISPSAFYQLNRTVQRKLFGALFDE